MFIKKEYRVMQYGILSLFLLGVCLWLFSQINTFYVPNSDFQNYLNVGHRMLVNPLDPQITSAPLYSVIVYLLELVLPIKYPGIFGGVAINIFCFILTLLFIWLLSERLIGFFAFLPILFFSMNPVMLYVVLQPSNIPFSLLLIVMALYYYMLRPELAYRLVFIATVTRIESIPLIFVFICGDLLFYKRLRCSKLLIFSFILVLAWYMRPVVPHDNYIDEMIFRKTEIPNFEFIRNSFVLAPFSYNLLNAHKNLSMLSLEGIGVIIILLWIILGIRRFQTVNRIQIFVITGYMLWYTAIHAIFPDRVIRYSYPLLPFFYLILCWPIMLLHNRNSKITIFSATIFLCAISFVTLGFSLINRTSYIDNQKFDRAERRIVSEWLNKNVTRPTTVYTFEHYVFQYYIENKMIHLKDTINLSAWKYDLCKDNKDIYIVFDNQTDSQGSYFDHLNGIEYFLQLKKSKEFTDNIYLIKHIQIGRRYANIYTFNDKPKENWCEQTFQ